VRRVALGLGVCLAVLMLGASASADNLTGVVTTTQEPGLTAIATPVATILLLALPQGQRPLAKVTLGVPADASVDLASPPGTTLGSTTFLTQDGFYDGDVKVVDPASLAGDPTVAACAPGAHAAAWTVSLSALGETVTIPILVDPSSDPAIGIYQLQICLPSNFDSVTAQVVSIIFTFPGTGVQVTDAKGEFTWHALATAFAQDTPTPDPASTRDYQGVVAVPTLLTQKHAFDRKTKVLSLSGRLTLAGRPAPRGVRIDVATLNLAGNQIAGLAARWHTSAAGAFAGRIRIKQAKTVVLVAEPWHPACATTAPAGCYATVTPIAGASFRVKP